MSIPNESRNAMMHVNGSDKIEKDFREYFKSKNLPVEEFDVSDRADSFNFLAKRVPVGGLFTGYNEDKTVEQAALFGGQANRWHDPNYHLETDTLGNMNLTLYEINIKAMAHIIALYANSWEGFPPRDSPPPANERPTKDRDGELWRRDALDTSLANMLDIVAR
jgi:hypothetical protein